MTLPNESGLPNAALPEHGELAGKSAVVTGATEGTGFHAARLLAIRGATVLITDAAPLPQLNDLLAQITGQRTLHPLYPRFPAADRDLLQRSHRPDVTAFRSATGSNPGFGRSALAFVPSS